MPRARFTRKRRDLSAFVRQRRAALRPEDFGFKVGFNRRVMGLRREEVAAIAGVGLTWYTWFEQGRDINVSNTFLENITRALMLNPSERSYLYFLAEKPLAVRNVSKKSFRLEPSLVRLADGLGARPAYIKDLRWDLLYWNRAASFVFGEFSEVPEEDRNIAWLTFADGPFRYTMKQWEQDACRLVARLRADYASAAGDELFQRLIDRLLENSHEFRRIWQTHAVLETAAGTRQVNIKGLGTLEFDYTVCRIGEPNQTKLVIYAVQPEQQKSEAFLEECSKWIGRQVEQEEKNRILTNLT